MILSSNEYESRGGENPVETLIFTWVFCITIPAVSVAWASTKNLPVVCAAAVLTPALAIFQGSLGILRYRFLFKAAPLPRSPCHGVVLVHPDDKEDECSNGNWQEQASKNETPPLPPPLESLCTDGCECTRAYISRDHDAFLQNALKQTPIRLLVIGDSLAIGVGQEKCPTPIIPEAIAKTISKRLGGKVVYWTCHGAPGASTGWIVREIERGAKHLIPNSSNCGDDDNNDDDDSCSDTADVISAGSDVAPVTAPQISTDSDTAALTKKSDSTIADERCIRNDPSLSEWKERLTQHRKRFHNPDAIGPYDVIVAVSGPNDLKSTFFPFMLTGEDLEFRRQAKQRGGSYYKELRRLFDTLKEKMQRSLSSIPINQNVQRGIQNIRHTVELATETVREKVEETMEYISPGSSSRFHSPRSGSDDSSKRLHFFRDEDELVEHDEAESGRKLPLVVLIGMPVRSLPILQMIPLCWWCSHVMDMMDMHKRNFAKAHPDEVMFVPPASRKDLDEYEHKTGEIWKQRCHENMILALRDISKRDCRKIEGDMRQFYDRRRQELSAWGRLPLLSRIVQAAPASPMFSLDLAHPSDEGCDFYGRYVGSAVAQELAKKR